jgi:CRP-like cAMP-binding protein
VLVAEGAPEAFLAVLVEGRAVVCKRDGDGVEKLIASLSEGHCFGEISLLDGEPRSATVRATTPARILCLSAEDLERLVREKPKLAVEVYRRLGRLATQHLRSTSGRLVDVLATGPA